MKKQILLCSIFRNRERFIDRWYYQINNFIEYYNKQYDFLLSVYENDSIDNTKQKLQSLQNINLKNFFFSSETINTNFYPSIINEDRVKNLANARNACLNIKQIDFSLLDKIIFIEPDFFYDLQSAIKIISAEEIHNKKFDIISGISLYNGNFYDTWATRKNSSDLNGQVSFSNSLEPFWSTFNGFCSYNPKPFAEGATFGWYNHRLQSFDCDTVVICETFREKGYNNIYIDKSAVFIHEN